MSRTLFHCVFCPDASAAHWQALLESPHPQKALYLWFPGAHDGAEPPDPVRAALWSGCQALGDRIGFLAARDRVLPGSVWRETKQGWLARRLRPMPGVLWTGDAEAFDAAFDRDWAMGFQAIFALAPDASLPTLDEETLIEWTRPHAVDPPPIPAGVRAVIRAGADGTVAAVHARSAAALETFTDAFRAGLDWRQTTFQRAPEAKLAREMARLAGRAVPPKGPPETRWFDERTDR